MYKYIIIKQMNNLMYKCKKQKNFKARHYINE